MKTLIATLRRAVTRARLAIAESDLAWMEDRAPRCLREQRAHVRALAEQLDTLEAGLCDPCPAEAIPAARAEDVRARIERNLKEALL
jgi:hypothetical protein